MIDLFKGFFKKETSSQTAKDRLRLVLMSDHLALAPEVVAALKADLLAVISRYVEIDPSLADVTFESRDRDVAMLASIPILSVRDRDPRPTPPGGGGGGGSLASGGGNAATPPREPARVSASAASASMLPESPRRNAGDAPAAVVAEAEPAAVVAEAAPPAPVTMAAPVDAATAAPVDAAAAKARTPRRRRRRKPRVKIEPLTA